MTEAKVVWKASEERNSGPLFPSVRAGNDSSHNNMRFLIMAFAPEPRGMPIYRDWPSVPQSRPPLSPKKASGDPLYFIVNILFLTVENVNDMKTNNEGARRFFANCANAFRFHSQFFLIFVLLSPFIFLTLPEKWLSRRLSFVSYLKQNLCTGLLSSIEERLRATKRWIKHLIMT